MKIVIAAVVGFATLLGGGFYVTKSTNSTPATETTVSVPKSTSPSFTLPTNASSSNNTKTVLKPAVDKTRVLYLNDQVMEATVQPLISAIKKLNEKSSDPIYLLLDSPGGSVLDGAQLISEMEASKAPVYTVCTRLCASMAAMIHGHGVKRYALDRAILMYHPATAGAQGQVKNMKSSLGTIDRYIEKMVSRIVSRTKIDPEQFQKEVAYELWIDAEDANERGLNDATVNLSVPSQPEGRSISFAPPSEESKKGTKPTFDVQWISPYPAYWKK